MTLILSQADAVLVAMTGIASWDTWRLEVEESIQAVSIII